MESLSFSIAVTAAGERSHMEINALVINDVSFCDRKLFVGLFSSLFYVVAFSLLSRTVCEMAAREARNGNEK